MKKLHLTNWFGIALLVWATGLLVWEPALVPADGDPAIFPARWAVACFMVIGAALALPPSYRHTVRAVYVVCGSVLMLIAGSQWLEVILNARFARTLGNWLWLHQEPMPPNAATAFFLTGAALVAIARVRRPWQAAFVQLACVGVLALGLFDVGGSLVRLDIFYGWYQHSRMPVAAAIALIGVALAMFALAHRADWYREFASGAEDTKIIFIGGVLLLLVALTAGLFGSGVLAQQTEETIKRSLAMSTETRARVLETSIERAAHAVTLIAQRPRLRRLLQRLTDGNATAAERSEVNTIVDNIFTTTGVTAVEFFDGAGRSVARRGEFLLQPKLDAPLNNRGPARLALRWRERLALNVSLGMHEGGQHIGTVVADVAVPAIGDLFAEVAGLGHAGAMAVCAPLDDARMQCFPNRLNGSGLVAPRTREGKPLPMDLALAGSTGVINSVDVFGTEVIAAHAPIADTGLGLVLRTPTAEVYRPIRSQFQRVLLMLLGLVFAGILLLRWQINPLVRRLMFEVRERKLAEERLSHIANHDALTGLPNRTLLFDRLRQTMADANRHDSLLAVMFLDLDRFKVINDTLGHEAGDRLLKAVAARLRLCARAGDTIARLGGDEFTLVITAIKHVDDAARVAQKVLDSLARPLRVDERELFVTASIGITLYPFDSDDMETLLKNADIAMYRAKEQGRNNFQFYTAEMNARALERLALESALRKALEREEFRLYYQPQIDLRSGEVFGMEAVLRWQHPELGLVPPAQFVPLAEETGLIVPIGEWALRTACAHNKAWQDAGLPRLRVAVNLSARQFRQRQLGDVILQVLDETGLSPHYLGLELTESIVMQQAVLTDTILDMLHSRGVEIAIDDFGTGYSSLSYLKRFPIDVLKIDRSFVRDINSDPNDAALCNAIVGMGHSLGMRVVAEGVETATQLQFLADNDCDGVQGYYFSKALSHAAFTEALRAGFRFPPPRAQATLRM